MFNPQLSVLPSELIAANARPVFWYLGTGHTNSDEFFDHGGGFGTYFVNKISLDPSGQLSMQIEHTREVALTAQVIEHQPVGRGAESSTTVATFSATLTAGQDNFTAPSNVTWHLATSSMEVLIVLQDPFLQKSGSPYYTYKKTFVFSPPGGSTEP
jgi:hypothetical protein